MTRPLLILKTGSTFEEVARREGDFEDWIRSRLGLGAERVRIVDARTKDPLPEPAAISAIVITGSHAMVTDHPPWLSRASQWLEEQISAETPVLGICFGHQLLGEVLGGEVGWHPGGREIGTRPITLLPAAEEDRLFRGLPAVLPAHTSHAQSVLTLPPGAVRLARSDVEPNHAFRCGEITWGVQFHPEFSESAMRSYIAFHRRELIEQGMDPEALLESVTRSPATRILGRFGDLARCREGAASPDAV